MEDQLIDWFIWYILQLQQHQSEPHSQFTFFTPIGCRSDINHTVQMPEKDQIHERKEEIQRFLKQFDDLKHDIMTSPCPIQKLREEFEKLQLQENLLLAKEAEYQAQHPTKGVTRNEIMADLRKIFSKENANQSNPKPTFTTIIHPFPSVNTINIVSPERPNVLKKDTTNSQTSGFSTIPKCDPLKKICPESEKDKK